MLERLRIKKLKADLEDQKTKKKKVEEDIGNISDLEFDREYVSGQDSLPTSEEEQSAKVCITYSSINSSFAINIIYRSLIYDSELISGPKKLHQ